MFIKTKNLCLNPDLIKKFILINVLVNQIIFLFMGCESQSKFPLLPGQSFDHSCKLLLLTLSEANTHFRNGSFEAPALLL